MTFIDYTQRAEEIASLNTCTVYCDEFPVYLGPFVADSKLASLRATMHDLGYECVIRQSFYSDQTGTYHPTVVDITGLVRFRHVERQQIRAIVRKILSPTA